MQMKQLFLSVGVWGLTAATTLATTAPLMSVQIHKAFLRDAPTPLGKVVTTLAYCDKVTVQSQNGAWLQVTGNNQTGWIHSSALTTKKIELKGEAVTKTTASSSEMALAGKGFNPDVEKQFKENHKEIDFSPIDKMEKIKIPIADIQAFAKEGKLQSAGGAK